MIPSLPIEDSVPAAERAFAAELRGLGFRGEIEARLSERLVQSTDNSLYQVVPELVCYPRDTADTELVVRAASADAQHPIALRPRGGATGTNAQSLGAGVVVDVSRHMNRILSVDAERRLVRVEAGVVKDQLNAAIKGLGLFFPPELSTSNRATIGGMVSTDASGQGSCLYGKTRDYVRAVTMVLHDGTAHRLVPVGATEEASLRRDSAALGEILEVLKAIARDRAEDIARIVPRLSRVVTGYDLAHLRNAAGELDLASIVCGSEGTLGIIAEIELTVAPIPAAMALVVVTYADFDSALRDARVLAGLSPAAIETIDARILTAARGDASWLKAGPFFEGAELGPQSAACIIEFHGERGEQLDERLENAGAALAAGGAAGRLGHAIARRPDDIAAIWDLRKRAVGIAANTTGLRAPVPFVEDTAVPPEHLADYVARFRRLLEAHGLEYAMFGHADAGVMHVRPALDMTLPADRRLVRVITEEVVALTREYGGVLWGEHGKGVRSEFSPQVFGPLYPAMQAVKAAFDPRNQFNPGKIASVAPEGLLGTHSLPFRGAREAEAADAAGGYGRAFNCNGNGACFDFEQAHVMCPSWKATRDRRHSPKGRATLVREWLRLLGDVGHPMGDKRPAGGKGGLAARLWNSRRPARARDFSSEVKEALDGCLGCKGCSGTCPVRVDVPTMRAQFLEAYHGRYLRSPSQFLIGRVEGLLPLARRLPQAYDAMVSSRLGKRLLSRLGLVHLPVLGRASAGALERADPRPLARMTPEERARCVVLVSDRLSDSYDPGVVADVARLIAALGKRPMLAPDVENGKPLHVTGHLAQFEAVARSTSETLNAIAAAGVPLVGIDPAMTLVYRDEYRKALGAGAPQVLLLQEWLAGEAAGLSRLAWSPTAQLPGLLPHCSEQAMAAGAVGLWPGIFEACGLALDVVAVGCCGMAGTFGHERANRAMSETVYRNSWEGALAPAASGRTMLATGFSCRSQVAIMDGTRLDHPVSFLVRQLRDEGAAGRAAG